MNRSLALLVVLVVAPLLVSATACSSEESPPAALYQAEEATSVTAEELFAVYADKPKAADKLYKDELLAVTGVMATVGTDLILEAPEVVLSGGVMDQTRGIDCVFDPRYADQVAALEDGATVTVLGICQGSYEVNVLLLHCQPAEE